MLLRGERLVVAAVVVSIGLGVGIVPSARATDYFISESLGDDAWSGLLPEPNGSMTDGPKQSLAAASTLLDTTVGPGDRVLLRRGDTWSGDVSINVSAAAGTPAEAIVVGAYGTGARPTIDRTTDGTVITVRGHLHPARRPST
jgi:hypothetical protein